MLSDESGHLHHVDRRSSEDLLELLVVQDGSLVLWILKIVLLDVDPKVLSDF